ncbi:MAG TPA: excinuclease ABC subunit UvrA [Polyangia bacterium]|jgi:excinuclease ABC subunit A
MQRRDLELDHILIRGAREHNLRIDRLEVPKKQLVVFTGVSGSGKSSLAFDTLYAEGQRRYVESLSSYARQFLGQMDKPKYDHIKGLSPTIAIEQKSASNNPRSTVGTITEIHDYLRVLYARAGEQRCHLCGGRVAGRSAAEIVSELLSVDPGQRLLLLAPVVVNRKGEHRDVLKDVAEQGYVRVLVDGEVRRVDEVPPLDKKRKHSIAIVVDRVQTGKVEVPRLTDSVETALRAGKGQLQVQIEGGETRAFSEERSCPTCGIGFPELSPPLFSFNSPLGMCPDCTGLGTRLEVVADLVISSPERSLSHGAIDVAGFGGGITESMFAALQREYGVDPDKPWQDLTARQRDIVLYGTGDRRVRIAWQGSHGTGSWNMRWEGVIPAMMRRLRETKSESMQEYYRQFMRESRCRACKGERLRPESRAVYVGERSIVEVAKLTVGEAAAHFHGLDLGGAQALIAAEILKEINGRLTFLLNVGLDYLSIDRAAASLSGGEAQRIRLASQLGSELSGVMYVLDEPSIGLHPRDNRRLIETLARLRDTGNSVIVVEHDQETIESADHVIDFGPGAGAHGGQVVFEGTPDELRAADTLTGKYLSGRERIEVPRERREARGELRILGAAENNLADIDVTIPLGQMVAVTGVSGAGKSSLVIGILYPSLRRALYRARDPVGTHRAVMGGGQLDKVVLIDQDPIGRTSRSNPATYTKAFDPIRELFAGTPEARAYGYKPGRFSFNVRGGRCEACEGDGHKRVEMHFLPDVYVPCEVCHGQRYNEATLRVTYKGKNIAQILDTSVEEARELFANHRTLRHILDTVVDVGLGYVALGQPAPTLSGGEAQRIKLSRELARRDTGQTLYILDEPTTGLHFDDIRKLLGVLGRLADAGNTVVVIEHNLDVVKTCDHVIDLGPEGGAAGGRVVASGTPEEVAAVRGSYTGQFLRRVLGGVGKTRRASSG